MAQAEQHHKPSAVVRQKKKTKVMTKKDSTNNGSGGGDNKKKMKKLSKSQRRRLKKREQKRKAREEEKAAATTAASKQRKGGEEETVPSVNEKRSLQNVEIEYVPDDSFKISIEEMFSKEAAEALLKKFQVLGETGRGNGAAKEQVDNEKDEKAHKDSSSSETNGGKVKISNRKKKMLGRLSVAKLKQIVDNPDVVEVHDVNSLDPELLVYLKAYTHAVPVPRHWLRKSKYLQRKRGIEKKMFDLPEFIKATGIAKMRSVTLENEEGKSLRQKARERMTAKLGKIDIDYKVLYNAFFKHQTKPPLEKHCNLYYEGREFETKTCERRPGVLSEMLKEALGMTEDGTPPPWLINMQRYGPPPSYPKMKIPGLSAPIPQGASFGYHPGGWGQPPVDQYGQPLYGDVFGTGSASRSAENDEEATRSKTRWGQLEEEEEEEEEEGDSDKEAKKEDSNVGAMDATNVADSLGTASVATTYEAADDAIDIRKGIESVATVGIETPIENRQLYQVLEQKSVHVGDAMYGSDKRYVVPSSFGGGDGNGGDSIVKNGLLVANDSAVGSRKRKSRFADRELEGAAAPKKSREEEDFKF